MSERYSRLYATEKNLYISTSPVIICAGALLKDNETGRLIAQLKFKNISSKQIKSISIKLTLLDSADRVIDDNIQHTYLDLQLKRDEEIGHKEPVYLSNSNTRAFKVVVTEVVFEDKSIWSSNNCEWKSVSESKPLYEYLKDSELVEQYRIDCGESAVYVPRKLNDIWFCTCGEINSDAESACYKCGLDFKKQVSKFDIQALNNNLTERKFQAAYEKGIEALERGTRNENIDTLGDAIKCFRNACDFKVSAEKIEFCENQILVCQQQIKKIRDKKETERLENEKKAKEKAELRKKRIKKIVKICTPIVIICVSLFVLSQKVIIPNYKYTMAMKLLEEEKYMESSIIFSELDDYRNSREQIDNIRLKLNTDMTFWADNYHLELKSDGKVDIKEKEHSYYSGVKEWTNIMTVSLGANHIVGLKSDGTAVAVGINMNGQCDVGDWTDIIAIDAAYHHTVGLKKNGTVAVTGWNLYGQCDVSNWTNIVAVYTSSTYTVGLKSNGEVVIAGAKERAMTDAEEWSFLKANNKN